MVYKVLFPIQQPVPLLLDLQVNGQSICKGEAAHGRVSTTIKHFHILESSRQFQTQSQPYSNSNNYNYNYNNNFQTSQYQSYRPQTTYRPYYQQTTQLTPLIDRPIYFDYNSNSNSNSNFNDENLDSVCGKLEDKAVGLVVRGDSYRKGGKPIGVC